MKLSNDTLSVLKNFGSINQGLLFKQGKTLKTVSSLKNILAEATINEEIPTEFGVYDLNTDRIIDTIEKWEICETIYSYVPDALPFVKIKFLKIPSTFMSKEILEWDFRSDYYQFEAQRMLEKQRDDIIRSHMVQF